MIFVALSEDVSLERQFTGSIHRRIELVAWPSARDVLCLYDRPGEAGDVGQVTRAVLNELRSVGAAHQLFGTGRAMSVIRDLLTGRYVVPGGDAASS